ncbi:MAG: alkyl hydroperoxide reductase [Actinobacteria bacterium]|nr:alkyl hydroperoxide reductase [Actinomycetota bacterium]
MRELEARFADELVVIGVHSGKFRAERVTANIAAAAQRLRIEHAIVNDRQFRVWRAYGVTAWPTVVLLDPAGGIVGAVPGEFLAGQLVPVIEGLIADFERADTVVGARLSRGPWPLKLPPEPGGPLAFPGRVLAARGDRLFVADSGHDRILELQVESEGKSRRGVQARVVRVIGSGRRGAGDGSADQASFDHPQGMALTPGRLTGAGLVPATGAETLLVADAENHTVRAVALPAGAVTTIAGTGSQARRANEAGVGRGAALSSPWDVELLSAAPCGITGAGAAAADALVIAMAGAHQLWRLDLVTGAVEPWIGTGREDLSDGPPFRCTLAQPMGMRLVGRRLFFADSESSAVRFADLDGRDGPEVETLVGKGLFEFGDEDGQGGHVRLQHPYDLTAGPGPEGTEVLYVADTYNDRIKAVVPATRRSDAFVGGGEPGHEDGDAGVARFWGPQGVAVADGRLFVADTNNHAVRVVDLVGATPVVRTLEIVG